VSDEAPPPPPEGGERRRRRRRRRPQEEGLGPQASGLGPEEREREAQPEPQQRPQQQPRAQQQRPEQPQRDRSQQQQRPQPQRDRPQRDWQRRDNRDQGRAEADDRNPPLRGGRPRPEAPQTTAEMAALDVIEPSSLEPSTVFDRRSDVRTTAELSVPDDEPAESGSRATYGYDDDGPAKEVSWSADLPADAPPGDLDPLSFDAEGNADFAATIVNVVGVRLASSARVHVCDAGDHSYAAGDEVVVDTERGPRLGTVAWPSTRRPHRDKPRRVLRRPSDGDRKASRADAGAAQDALRIAKDKARDLGLPIKVFRVEALGNRLALYFTSDERIDVRDLVREVGQATGARIELRQLGVRDEAKMIGGIGSCGQELCCTTWLPEFVPVSIKMAKDQGLVLNPTKVSGQCGRLKCCLVYEQATYAEMRKGLPKLGKRVLTPTGEGRVVEVDVLRQRIRVSTGPGESTVYAAGEVKPMFPPQQQGRHEPNAEPSDDSETEPETEPSE
jgi:cell fate regulator YaaT (PSP1 superfamily)